MVLKVKKDGAPYKRTMFRVFLECDIIEMERKVGIPFQLSDLRDVAHNVKRKLKLPIE